MPGNFDKPEPRWQAILALIALGGIYTALPRELSVGPRWLLFAAVITLLIPTVVAHRTGTIVAVLVSRAVGVL